MGIQRIRERKKKQREERAKNRVLRRREVLRKKRKEETAQATFAELAYQDKHGKPQPIINDPLVQEIRQKQREDQARAQLERNLEILKELEMQYEAEQAARQECNEKLEAEGHKTIREKMDSLAEKAQAILNKEAQELCGETQTSVEGIAAESDSGELRDLPVEVHADSD